ncbi:MAG TPA: inositol monophosphatase [Verrucomicrobiae bacterium]|nr:inositol monophosphatase [Verrucomicrobiae bacterium]
MAEFLTYRHEMAVATEIAREAGVIMLQYFDGDQEETAKADGSALTIADTTINKVALERLGEAFPNDGVIGEEASSVDTSQSRRWYCDPIDGTKGYTWGLPLPMFSLGLAEEGQPVMGVAYDPFFGEQGRLYTGIPGEGSFCNDKLLRVSPAGLHMGRVAVTSSVQRLAERTPKHVTTLLEHGARVASFPAGVVQKACLVANGRMVGCIQEFASPHDIAAVRIIVEEAGGRMTDWNGDEPSLKGPMKGVIISNGVIHDELVDMTDVLEAA